MICSNCHFYTRLIEDDDDWCGTPWCLLADDALPDECFAPFECICPDQKTKEDTSDDMAGI